MLETLSDIDDEVRLMPDPPEWLADLLQHEDGEATEHLNALSYGAREIYTLFHRAKLGHADSACMMAERFEGGAAPGGPALEDAMRWYEYAAYRGSAKAAFRLAHLQAWKNPKETLAGLDMALLALQNISRESSQFGWKSTEGWNMAAQIVLHAVEKGMVDDGNKAIDKLMRMDGFQKHPDFARIANEVRRLSTKKHHSGMELVVVETKIHEDGDFRVGIYRQLEKPLPLVAVPADVSALQATLDREFPWFSKINTLVCRQMSAAQYGSMPGFRIRPLLLAGVPGIGKSTWVKRLAELCNIPFRPVMAAGSSDSMFIRGTPRGWASARPGAVLQVMVAEGVANPLFMVDELEKASSDNKNGRLWDVLLQLLEPASSRTYLDECLQVPCDLSWVSWIATANELSNIPRPLLERFTIVTAEPPGEGHFMTIVNGAVNRYARELGIDSRMLPTLSRDEMDVLRRCKSPREIARTVMLMMERGLVDSRPACLN